MQGNSKHIIVNLQRAEAFVLVANLQIIYLAETKVLAVIITYAMQNIYTSRPVFFTFCWHQL
jgi:hypothetical protein